MSAAGKPWKVEAERDRRSNMPTSSINAPAKKAGAGGQYTWGSAMDVTDYEPVGLGGLTKVVTMAPPPGQAVQQPLQQAPTAPVALQDAQQFPALGTRPMMVQPTPVQWGQAPAVYTTATGQPVQANMNGSVKMEQQPTIGRAVSMPSGSLTMTIAETPKVILGQDMLRAGVPALDAQHPRHVFARKPHKHARDALASQQDGLAIDWTQAGTTSFQQQVIRAVVNPAHLGPYVVAPQQGPPIATLKALPTGAYIPSQKLMKLQVNAAPKIGKPQVMFQRKC